MMSKGEVLETIIKDEKLDRWEGRRGVENLAILCREIGYRDSQYFGQFSHRGCFGDLINFLEDNPGAVEAVVEFIRENAHCYDLPEYDDQEGEEDDSQ